MATSEPWARDLDSDQREFYRRLDPAQWVCRGRRRHRFHTDELLPPGQLQDGLALVRVTGGWELRDACLRGCGRYLVFDTDNRGAINWDSKRYGGGGSRYHATGLNLTAANDRQFFEYQQGQQLRERIQLTIKALRAKPAVA